MPAINVGAKNTANGSAMLDGLLQTWRAEGRNTCGSDEMDKIRQLHLMGIRVRLWQRIARPGVKARDLVELVIEPAGGRRG